MGQNLWRSLVLRDHLLTLIDQPLSQTEVKLPEKESDIALIKESSKEANKVINDPLEDLCKELRKNWKGQEISQPQDWKKFYMDCNNKLNLSGEWEGYYGSMKKELLTLYHNGFTIYAKKNTGHSNIPAGKLTWKMKLDQSLSKGKGEVHLADYGFKNPRWSTAYIEVDFHGEWIKVTFANVRKAKKGSPITGMSVKFEPYKFKSN